MVNANEANEDGLTTLAVFDQHQSVQPIQSVQSIASIPIKTGLVKDKSIKTRSAGSGSGGSARNSPKLVGKVKREPESRPNKFIESNMKPFNSGSGIPKPMAAVKGTAKVTIPKAEQPADMTGRERTPGDGKEVSEGRLSIASPIEPEKPVQGPPSPGPEAPPQPNEGSRLSPSADDGDVSKAENNGETAKQEIDDDESVTVQPMVPLFAPDDSLKRIPRLSGNFGAAKRATNVPDALDGYMSESGASLYARKAARFAINQRNRDCDRYIVQLFPRCFFPIMTQSS